MGNLFTQNNAQYVHKNHNPLFINMKNFHERLTFVIETVLNKSGNAVARDLNVNGGAVSKYKKGDISPSTDFILKFCSTYGVCGNFLINGIEPIMVLDMLSSSPDGDGSVAMWKKEQERKISVNKATSKIKEALDILTSI